MLITKTERQQIITELTNAIIAKREFMVKVISSCRETYHNKHLSYLRTKHVTRLTTDWAVKICKEERQFYERKYKWHPKIRRYVSALYTNTIACVEQEYKNVMHDLLTYLRYIEFL